MTVGGDGDWETHSDTSADSVWLADLNPSAGTASYTHEPTGWGNQPSRRIYHGCAAPVFGGDVYVTGGMTADGSGTTYNSTYKFSPASKEFTSLPAMPVGLYHHSTVLLGNGTLLNFGGVYMSPETSSPILEPLDRVFTLQTNSADPAWHTVGISGPAPAPRRGCSATLNPDGTVFVYGGADVNFSTVYSDGWILDPNSLSWTQVITASQGEFFCLSCLTNGQALDPAMTTLQLMLAADKSSCLEVSTMHSSTLHSSTDTAKALAPTLQRTQTFTSCLFRPPLRRLFPRLPPFRSPLPVVATVEQETATRTGQAEARVVSTRMAAEAPTIMATDQIPTTRMEESATEETDLEAQAARLAPDSLGRQRRATRKKTVLADSPTDASLV
jgi:hypothetical protein